jgi:hypothetical protein
MKGGECGPLSGLLLASPRSHALNKTVQVPNQSQHIVARYDESAVSFPNRLTTALTTAP